MSQNLIFYTNPMSRGRIVRWMLEEVGEPYSTEILSFDQGMKTPDFLAVNPMGKVPAIRHGDAVVTETAAICTYLADAFPQAGLAPRPGQPRAAYYRWLFFGAGPLEAAITNRACGFEVTPEKGRMVGYGSFEKTMDTLEYALSQGDYIAADHFTAADLYIGAQVGFGLKFGSIEKRPAFQRYHERLLGRPAYGRASRIDDRLMAEAASEKQDG